MPCPDPENLAAFAAAASTKTPKSELVSHLSECKQCRETVANAIRAARDIIHPKKNVR